MLITRIDILFCVNMNFSCDVCVYIYMLEIQYFEIPTEIIS